MSADRRPKTMANGRHTPEHRPAEDVAAPDAGGDGVAPRAADDLRPPAAEEPAALPLLVQQLHELRECAAYYLAAKTDRAKLALRNAVLWIAFAAVAFVAVAGLSITAAWLLLNGMAGGASVLFGGRLWAGNMATGAVLLAGLGLAMYVMVAVRRFTSRERAVRKYEQRQARQQAEFGRSIVDPTAAAASHKKRTRLSGRSGNERPGCNGPHVAADGEHPDTSG